MARMQASYIAAQGATDKPIRAKTAYYAASFDDGQTWSAAERPAGDLQGDWGRTR